MTPEATGPESLSPTVQEDGGWPEREADIAWLEGEREEHAHESGYMLDHELAEARSIVARIDRLLAIARSGSAEAVAPEGWVLVPREPTEAMVLAAVKSFPYPSPVGAEATYHAMLAAAPPPAGAGE